jgi:hypothetical protein
LNWDWKLFLSRYTTTVQLVENCQIVESYGIGFVSWPANWLANNSDPRDIHPGGQGFRGIAKYSRRAEARNDILLLR